MVSNYNSKAKILNLIDEENKKVKLKPVKDRKKLPPNVEHKVLTKEELKKKKLFWANKAKELAKLNGGKK